MSLSPYEIKVLEKIEEDLHTEDPTLAAAFRAEPPRPSAESPSGPLIRHVLGLLAVLIGLVVISALFAEQLGTPGLGILTFMAVVPWLIGATRSAERRPWFVGATGSAERRQRGTDPTRETTRADRGEQGIWGTPRPILTTRRSLLLSVALVLIVAAVIPPEWSVVIPLVLALVILPWLPRLTERVVEWVERWID